MKSEWILLWLLAVAVGIVISYFIVKYASLSAMEEFYLRHKNELLSQYLYRKREEAQTISRIPDAIRMNEEGLLKRPCPHCGTMIISGCHSCYACLKPLDEGV